MYSSLLVHQSYQIVTSSKGWGYREAKVFKSWLMATDELKDFILLGIVAVPEVMIKAIAAEILNEVS